MGNEKTNEDLASKGILVAPDKGKDEFSVKSKVNSPELVFAIKQEIRNIRWKIGMNWLLIGKFLYLVKRDKGYKLDSTETFGQWIADNREFIGMGLRAAYYLVEIWENLVMKLGVTPDKLADVDRSSAREICKYSTPKNVQDLIQLAKDNTHTELVRKLKAMAKGKELSRVEIVGDCKHKNIIVLYKCHECSQGFYGLPPTAKVITDKSGLVNEKEAQKIAPGVKVVKENFDNSYSQASKEEKENITKKLK